MSDGSYAAAASAIALPGPRRGGYLIAAVLFLPIGVLGLASVGIVFLAAAAACIVAAVLAGDGAVRMFRARPARNGPAFP